MIGVIVNVLAVALGGVLGTVFSKKLSTRFTTELNKVFGVCAIGMGISSVPLMQNMPAVTSLVAVPQAAVFFALFFAAKAIYPLTTPTMIGDFKACGGFLLIATGCRIAKMQDFPVADMSTCWRWRWAAFWERCSAKSSPPALPQSSTRCSACAPSAWVSAQCR